MAHSGLFYQPICLLIGLLGVIAVALKDVHGSVLVAYFGFISCLVAFAFSLKDFVAQSAALLLERRRSRLKKKYSGAVCNYCNYILVGMPALGKCPECGAAFDLTRPEIPLDQESDDG